MITKMADKISVVCHFALVDILTWSFITRVLPKIHIWITFIKLSPKFEYGFCQTNDNQDGGQNGCHLSVCTCGHLLPEFFQISYGLLSSNFHPSLNRVMSDK